MIQWLAAALLLAAALAAVLLPLLRRTASPADRAQHDLAVYRDQLAEVEREGAAGSLTAAQAAASRAEIARRMLVVADGARGSGAAAVRAPSAVLPVLLALCLPAASLSLYLWLGAPGLPGAPFADRPVAADGHDMAALVERLAQRMREQPDDPAGWALLARSYRGLGRIPEAIEAYRQALALTPGDAELSGTLAELLVERADGMVTPEARAMFQALVATASEDPRARFYLGVAEAQAGNARGAIQLWQALLTAAPADAPWRPVVEARIREAAAAAGIAPPAAAPAPPPTGPSRAEVEAAQAMTPEDRTRMIRGMVESLAARLEGQPDDLEGWRRLARARTVLGEREAALAAHAKAAALAPGRLDVLGEYAAALISGLAPDAPWPPAFFALQRQILALAPDDPDARWFVELEAAQAQGPAAVLAHWEALRTRYPQGTAERTEIERRIEALRSAN